MKPLSALSASILLASACCTSGATTPPHPESAEAAEAAAGAGVPQQATDQGSSLVQAAPAPTPNEAPLEAEPDLAVLDYTTWQSVLRYVTDDGGFRYAALMADEEGLAALHAFVAQAAAADRSQMTPQQELAFLLNAYNANTVLSVVELWPVEGVLQEDGFFDVRLHTVTGDQMTLNQLENDQIRARFTEPRIHFLANCASTGCPWLTSEPISAANLEDKLETQTARYLRRTTRIDRDASRFEVSQIFEWFEADFSVAGGTREFIAARLPEADAAFVRDDANTLVYFDYDWSLNSRD